jgi:hypothetical protein
MHQLEAESIDHVVGSRSKTLIETRRWLRGSRPRNCVNYEEPASEPAAGFWARREDQLKWAARSMPLPFSGARKGVSVRLAVTAPSA